MSVLQDKHTLETRIDKCSSCSSFPICITRTFPRVMTCLMCVFCHPMMTPKCLYSKHPGNNHVAACENPGGLGLHDILLAAGPQTMTPHLGTLALCLGLRAHPLQEWMMSLCRQSAVNAMPARSSPYNHARLPLAKGAFYAGPCMQLLQQYTFKDRVQCGWEWIPPVQHLGQSEGNQTSAQ